MSHFLRPTIAEIDLDALAHNYHQIRSRVHPGVKILGVVKDNAYGHGAVVIARELERLGIDLLGVAFAGEGVELRDGGVKKPILVLSGISEEEIESVIEYDREEGIRPTHWHISSSAPMIDFPDSWFSLVRPGIMIYGSYPSGEYFGRIALTPVMRLRTAIGFLKRVPAGTKISYGGTYITQRESLIACLPVGYGDGYNRRLSNGGEVLLRAKRVPVVGRICMDVTMVDVTDVADVALGDEVVLIGRQGGDEITAEEIAEKIGTISYEVLCTVGKRVPRVSIRGGKPIEVEVYVRKEIEQRGH